MPGLELQAFTRSLACGPPSSSWPGLIFLKRRLTPTQVAVAGLRLETKLPFSASGLSSPGVRKTGVARRPCPPSPPRCGEGTWCPRGKQGSFKGSSLSGFAALCAAQARVHYK